MPSSYRSLGAHALAAAVAVAGCRSPERSAARGERAPRVVSLHDVTTEIVVALGAQDRLVGMAELYDGADELRAATAAVKKVEGLESILATEPDILLGLEIVRLKSPDIALRLEQNGTRVVLPALASIADVEALVREVARHLHKEAEGDRIVAELGAKIGAPVLAREPKRVFVYDCCDPPYTAGRRTVLSDLIFREGGRNVFADVDSAYTHVSWEEVALRKPEMIVVHAYQDGGSADVHGKLEKLRLVKALSAIPVTVMPLRFSLGGLKTGEAALLLRRAIATSSPSDESHAREAPKGAGPT
jgi:iron complex transport system substrate-binding protein